MGIAGVPDVGEVKEDFSVGGSDITLSVARRSKSLQFLYRLSVVWISSGDWLELNG